MSLRCSARKSSPAREGQCEQAETRATEEDVEMRHPAGGLVGGRLGRPHARESVGDAQGGDGRDQDQQPLDPGAAQQEQQPPHRDPGHEGDRGSEVGEWRRGIEGVEQREAHRVEAEAREEQRHRAPDQPRPREAQPHGGGDGRGEVEAGHELVNGMGHAGDSPGIQLDRPS